MMKMRYNVNTGLFEYCDRLTGKGIFYIFTKVGSEVAKKKQEHRHLKRE